MSGRSPLAEKRARLKRERLALRQRLAELDAELDEAPDAAERRYHAIFQSSVGLGALLDPDGTMRDINTTALEFIRLTRADVIGRRAWDVPGWENFVPWLRPAVEQIAVTKTAVRRDVDAVDPRGRRVSLDISLRPLLGAIGEVAAIVIEAIDVSAARQAERTARANEALLESVLAEVKDVISSYSVQDDRFVYLNPAAWLLLGRAIGPGEGGRREMLELVHAEDHTILLDALATVLDGGSAEIEMRLREPNDEVCWVRARAHSVREGDAVVRIDSIMTDVTHRRKAEEALQQLNAELEQRVEARTAELMVANVALESASRAKDEFLASMSHELRTPLNAVLGLSEALLEGTYGSLATKQRGALRRIEESGRHLLSLISDILDLSKLEAGQTAIEVTAVAVDEVCRACLRMVQEAAQKKRQTVVFAVSEDFSALHADERRLKQILVNLLSNAVKFTPEGGSIGLEVSAEQPSGAIVFTVWDTGIGIAASEMPRLFQPFVQLDSKLSRQHAGTGLGLALVRKLVELHGGRVTVTSEPGAGSRFSVILPRLALRRAIP